MNRAFWRLSLLSLVAFACAAGALAPPTQAAPGGGRKSLGTVTGSVRDSRGNPLAGAVVTLLREAGAEVVKQTKSAADGSFLAKVAPGKYVLRAAAEGFNAVTFSSVQVNASDELVYRFNLEPAGQGRTTAERRPDRHDPKFRVRGTQARRSIFQAQEGEDEVVEAAQASMAQQAEAESEAAVIEDDEIFVVRGDEREDATKRARATGVVQSFFTATGGEHGGPGFGLNFALANPVNERLDLIFAGQTGALNRIETTARVRAGSRHRVRATLGGARLKLLPQSEIAPRLEDALGQFSVRAVDEWVVRDGVVVVFGLDYSRFVGAGGADSFTPRFGVQFDANARTRVRAAYAPSGRESRVQSAAPFEDAPVLFYEQLNEPVALVDGKAVMERSRRLEFGVERVLDGASTIEATAFLDTTDGRGVGLFGAPLNALAGEQGAELLGVANQQGSARGLRIVYTRRISNSLKASAGYAFGRGQQLSTEGLTNPEEVFQGGFFQTAAAELEADLTADTRVRTVLRFSPRAAIFAIDPFAGRLAVYDPSLSILVTHELPNFGLPLRAQAILDARNLLDTLTSVEDGDTLLTTAATRRILRGGISVRF